MTPKKSSAHTKIRSPPAQYATIRRVSIERTLKDSTIDIPRTRDTREVALLAMKRRHPIM